MFVDFFVILRSEILNMTERRSDEEHVGPSEQRTASAGRVRGGISNGKMHPRVWGNTETDLDKCKSSCKCSKLIWINARVLANAQNRFE